MKKIIIAIDPGANGGIAIAFPDGKFLAEPMPKTEGDILDYLYSYIAGPTREGTWVVVFIEHVGGYVSGHCAPGSAMFNFGMGFGFLKGVTMALGARLELVRPQVWQKPLRLGTAASCANKTAWKNKLKAEAQRRFPGIKVTLQTADALLLLEYARKAVVR